jgi:protein-S-isoprenylcysteine O-methyltransferase Ste14
VRLLELKLPPPFLALLLAAAMWGVSHFEPRFAIPAAVRWSVAAVLALVGATFDILGLLAFRRSRTTVDPFKPHRASVFVASGVYKVTRNPMYLGLLFVLLGWAVFLGSLWPFLAPMIFVPFVNRFQIKPEELAMARLFGESYATYTAKVPRWL